MSQDMKQIKLYEIENQLVGAAVDKMVVEIINKKKEGQSSQTLVLTGCSPLSGTTSMSISLGIAMANCQKKTLLIDCDVRKALKYKKLNEETTKGLANYLLDFEGREVSAESVIYNTNIDNLSYVPCGVYSDNSTRILCSDRMDNFISQMKEKYECLIFDLPSVSIVPDSQILFKKADGIILISALGETGKKQIKEAKMKVKPYQEKYYGMIINKIPLDVYRQNVRDYDYYFVDEKGEQNLNGAYKKYQQRTQKDGGMDSEE